MKKERFEAITDAILAIIITLMVIEIRIPELTLSNIPKVLQLICIYAISFTFIAILWLNHHHIFAAAPTITINMVWMNFGLLFFTTLIPLATEHLSASFHEKANHIFFGFIIGTTTLFYTVIQRIAMKDDNLGKKHKANMRNWLAVVLLALSIPLSFVSIYLSSIIFLIVPIMYFLISKKEIE